MATFLKDPDASLDYRVDWTSWLEADETISTSEWTIADGFTQPFPATKTDKTATVWLAGGENGTDVEVTNRITTSSGRINDQTLKILIRHK